jgi:hypothetical protein
MIHPAARLGLARVLLAGHRSMTAEQAVSNATANIAGLHRLGLQVGPMACFGPHELRGAAIRFDTIGEIADLIEEEAGRRPWLPES